MAPPKTGLTVAIKFTPQAQADEMVLSEDQLNDRRQSLTNAADPSQNILANDGGGASVQVMAVIAGNAVDAVKADLAKYVDLANFSSPKAAYASAALGDGRVDIVNGNVIFNSSHDYTSLALGQVATVGTFTYVIRMGNGAFSVTTSTIKIVGENDGPVALADSSSVHEDSSIAGSVAANDFDPDSGETAALVYTPNGVVDGLTFNANGSYTFDAAHPSYQHLAEGATQDIVVGYTVTDVHGVSAASTLTIHLTGTNDVPMATVGTNAGSEDATISGFVHATDADDGAVLSYAVTGEAPAGFVMNADGSYSLDASNAAYQHLAEGAGGNLVIAYKATDQHGASSQSTLTIHLTGVNDAPVAAADAADVNEDTIVAGSVAGNDADPDDGETATLVYTLNGAADGLTFNPDGTYTFDAAHPSYQHLAEGATQDIVVGYAATDIHGVSATSTLTIHLTGTNDVPVAAVAVNAGSEDAAIAGSVHATDLDDGAVLSYAVAGQAPAGFAMNGDGSYTLDASDATYQHLAEGAGEDLVITYKATDEHGAGSQSTLTIHLTGVNDAPVAAADAADVNEDTIVAGSVAGNDHDIDDGAVLSYALTDDVAGLTFHADGSYSFDAGNAVYQPLISGQTVDVVANYTVTDEHGATSQSTLTIAVHGANEAPPPPPPPPPPAEPTLHTATVAWTVTGHTDPNGGHLALQGMNWDNFHLSVNGHGDFDWTKEGFNLSGDATASYRGPSARNATGNSTPETQLNFSTGDVNVSLSLSALADGSLDYNVALTNETQNDSMVNLSLTYDYWA